MPLSKNEHYFFEDGVPYERRREVSILSGSSSLFERTVHKAPKFSTKTLHYTGQNNTS
jgi:hypothetical protein